MQVIGGKRTESWWLYAVAGALMVGGPVWRELFVHRYPIRPELFLIPLAAASLGAMVALSSRAVSGVLGTIIFGVLLFVFADLQLDLHQSIRTLVLLAGCIVLALVFARGRATITAIALGAFYLSSLVRPSPAERTHNAAPSAARSSSAPLLVHIILDEQWGVGGFRAAGDTATANFLTDFYLSRGFELYEAAYSRYAMTGQSIPFTLSLGHRLRFDTDSRRETGMPIWKTMRQNPYFERLRDLGYYVRVYRPTTIDYCAETSGTVSSCDVQSANSIANFGFIDGSWRTRAVRVARYLLGTRSHVYATLRPEPLTQRRSVAGGGVALLERLTKGITEDHDGGTAYFAHVLLPHRPVHMDAECQVLADLPRRTDYRIPASSDSLWLVALRSYVGQVRCAHRLLDQVLDAVDSTAGRDRSIVIIHSDHGSRLTRRNPGDAPGAFSVAELNGTFAALLAVRHPNVSPVVHTQPTPVQDFLWEFSRSAFTKSSSQAWQHDLRLMTDSATRKEAVRPLAIADMLWARRPR